MEDSILEMLPKEVITKKGKQKFELGDVQFFGLYFSAHWCGPCRGFTPVLSEFYKEANKTKKTIEIIFMSSDQGEKEFNEYYSTMPWIANPFDKEDAKEKFDEKFNIQGIPTLLIFNKDGKIIDKEGRMTIANAANDEKKFGKEEIESIFEEWNESGKGGEGKNFFDMVSEKVQTKKGIEKLNLGDTPFYALYFSAHWCPPCRDFTPKLANFYEAVNKKKKQLEIIFVSSDKTENEYKEYYNTMPWIGVPFKSKKVKQKLGEEFKVEGIPTFLVFDRKNNLVDKNARMTVIKKTKGGKSFEEKDINSIIEKWTKGEQTIFELLPKKVLTKNGIQDLNIKDVPFFSIYFSAHWCPPCRGFTPILAKFYEAANKEKKKIEIIFISSDKEETGFKEYYNSMPWVANPFNQKEIKEDLDDKFEVTGIPTFLVFNKEGKLVDTEARGTVDRKTKKGARLSPENIKEIFDKWTGIEKNVLDLLPKEVLSKTEKVKLNITKSKFFGLYFSAHWCGPCQQFTPNLVKFYNDANKDKKMLEVIFISSDRNEKEFEEYYNTMPWVANPFENKDLKEDLNDRFNVTGIPTLLIFNQKGELVDDEARTPVMIYGVAGGMLGGSIQMIFDGWEKGKGKK